MAWRYLQTGHLLTPQGAPSAHWWYSGRGQGLNNPSREDEEAIGPIPRGTWTMAAFLSYPTSLGPVAIHLLPDEKTRQRIVLLGRDPVSFYAHDGNKAETLTASEGCLVCLQGTAGVKSLWDSGDHTIVVESGL